MFRHSLSLGTQYHPRGIFNFLQFYPVKSLSHTFVNLHNVFNIYEPTADLRACIKSHSGCNIEKEPLKNKLHLSFKEKSDQVMRIKISYLNI